METLDITSDGLREQGYSLKKEGSTVALCHNGFFHRCSFYKNDWTRSVNKVEDTLTKEGVDRLVIEAVKTAMSKNYSELMKSEGAISAAKKQAERELQQTLGMASKAIRSNSSMEEWQSAVQAKYQHLKNAADEQVPGLWLPLEFAISVKSILNIDNITIPFIGIVLGPPSSYKSVAVDLPKGARDTFYTDNFSPKAFVSHNSNMSEEELQDLDLLPKTKNKLFLVSELAPLFTTKDDELGNIIGIITRIADGNGYWSDTGARGHRGYDGPLMFVWLGAAVDIPYKVHKLLSVLGPKLYFLRLPMSEEDESSLLHFLQEEDFPIRIRKVKIALFEYLETLESCPNMQMNPGSGIPKLNWNSKDPRNEQAQRYIIYLAELLAYLRGTVSTWKTEDSQGLDYAYASRNVEHPRRAITQLHNLAKGHALSQGRDHITVDDDLPLITKVVLSGAASIDRVKVLNALLDKKDRGYMDVKELMEVINTSDTTAKKAMAELKALGLVDIIELGDDGRPLLQMRLTDNFEWFYTEEFKKLKGDYTPGDFKGYLVSKKKEKEEKEQKQQQEGSSSNGREGGLQW